MFAMTHIVQRSQDPSDPKVGSEIWAACGAATMTHPDKTGFRMSASMGFRLPQLCLPRTDIDLTLAHPFADRLCGPDTQQLGDRPDRRPLRLVLVADLRDHPHRPLTQLLRVHLRTHGLHPSSRDEVSGIAGGIHIVVIEPPLSSHQQLPAMSGIAALVVNNVPKTPVSTD